MEYTVKISSSATNESARYVDILQQTFEIIMKDSMLNGYELAGISDYMRQLCTQMDDVARKRKDLWDE
nr:MAG TPA: hypothetical protein [Caudoviricetes sp.]